MYEIIISNWEKKTILDKFLKKKLNKCIWDHHAHPAALGVLRCVCRWKGRVGGRDRSADRKGTPNADERTYQQDHGQ